MSSRTVYESSFTAVDPSGGSHVLNVFVDIIDAGTMGDSDATIEGLRSLQTEGGEPVNRLAKGSYQVVATGLRLSSTDPAAL